MYRIREFVRPGYYKKEAKRFWWSPWRTIEERRTIEFDWTEEDVKPQHPSAIKMTINDADDIGELINLLDNHEQCLAITIEHFFVCGVYWDEDRCVWKFRFNPYLTFDSNDPKVYAYFSMYMPSSGSPEFDVRVLQSKADLIYEIRQAIVESCVSNPDENIKQLSEKVRQNLGNVVLGVDGENYILCGMSATMEDYYFILLGTDMKLHFFSCVGKLEKVNWTEVDNDMRRIIENPELSSIITELRHQHFDSTVEEVELISY